MNFTRFIIDPLLNFVYPPVCISCDKLLSDGNQKICRDCWDALPVLTKNHFLYQETLNKLLAYGCICDLVSCYVFEREGPSQHITHALKYQSTNRWEQSWGKR